MAQPQKQFSYQGRHVQIDLKPIGNRWHWSYRIDDSSPFELSDTAESSEQRALLYAWTDARHRIDNKI